MVLLREYNQGKHILDWCHSVAHKRRDKGPKFLAGARLWGETFRIHAYFKEGGRTDRIPSEIFELLLRLIDEDYHRIGGLGLKHFYPEGYSAEEIKASLRYMYAEDKGAQYFRLLPGPDKNIEDLRMIGHIAELLDRQPWGAPPVHFDVIKEEMAAAVQRLLGYGRDAIENNSDLLALHFLCAFHLIELDLDPSRTRNPCYLTVDSTSAECLSLNIAIYERQKGVWDQIELPWERREPKFTASHPFSRPYLVTSLKKTEFLSDRLLNSKLSGCLFRVPLAVRKVRTKHKIFPARISK
jgi:hypothetical protein